MSKDVEVPAGLTGYMAGVAGALELGRQRLKESIAKYGRRELAESPLGFTNSIATLVVHICAAEVRMAYGISGTQIPAEIRAEFLLDEPPGPLPMPMGETASSLAAKLDRSFGILADALAVLTAADLDREIDLHKQRMTVRRALTLLANHQAMHLGQMQMLMIQLAPTGAM